MPKTMFAHAAHDLTKSNNVLTKIKNAVKTDTSDCGQKLVGITRDIAPLQAFVWTKAKRNSWISFLLSLVMQQ